MSTAIDFQRRQPLMAVPAVAWVTGLDTLAVVQGCESGLFAWSWDLAAPGSHRRLLRVWRGSVREYIETNGLRGGEAVCEEKVVADVLPATRDPYSSELKRWLAISRTMLADLIDTKLLRMSGPPKAAQGFEAACKIDRASIVAMLKSRKLGYVRGPRQMEANFF
jgi:hypothetical protein